MSIALWYITVFIASALAGKKAKALGLEKAMRSIVVLLVFSIGFWSGAKTTFSALLASFRDILVILAILVGVTIVIGWALDRGSYHVHSKAGSGKVPYDIIASVVLGFALGSTLRYDFDGLLELLIEGEITILLVIVGLDVSRILTVRVVIEEIELTAQALATSLLSAAASSLASSLALGKPLHYTFALISGMGWYSFTGPFVAGWLGPQAGFTAFMFNILREQVAFILPPFLRRPRAAMLSLGGATTMDNTLPVYISLYGREVAVASVSHGAILTLLVPVLLSIAAAL